MPDIRRFVDGEGMMDRSYDLKSLVMASIVAKITVAVINSCALATMTVAVAMDSKSFIGTQTSEPYSGIMGSSQSTLSCPRLFNYSIMLHYLLSQLLLWEDKCK
ncbi:hypothetical protein ACFLVA_01435 [Chloroflexota bacterium]